MGVASPQSVVAMALARRTLQPAIHKFCPMMGSEQMVVNPFGRRHSRIIITRNWSATVLHVTPILASETIPFDPQV
jgi:hypothetical protein